MLTTHQALDRVPGLTYRMLDHWSRSGLLPGVPKHPGSGYQREIPDVCVERLQIMVMLTVGFGVRASVAADLVDQLLTKQGRPGRADQSHIGGAAP